MKRLTSIQLILFMLFVGLTTIACEEEEATGIGCITSEDCIFGQQCLDGYCQDIADSGNTSGDSGNSADSVDTGNSSDSADTGNSADSADTGNSVDDSDSADTGNSVDDSDTADTGNSVDDGDSANTGDSVDDSDTANTGDSVDDSDTADSADDGDSADTGDSAPECGNSLIETGETCELSNTKNCTLIATGGYSGGLASCATDCLSWDVTNCNCPAGSDKNSEGVCEVLCGNGTVDGDEACEPTDTKECTTFTGGGFESGTATCKTDCTEWVKTSCICADGYKDNGTQCVDIDECTEGGSNCHANADCTNSPGSFSCECKDYYDGDGLDCTFCTTNISCGTECVACAGTTLLCKDNGDNTSVCVECLTTDDCSGDDVCNVKNKCAPACTVESWNFSPTSTGRNGTIQSWTVPSDATYKITAYGAQGGGADGGLGAKMSGDINLTTGIVIKILVGQKGTYYENSSNDNWYAGGGGGTFVVKNGATTNAGIYMIAGAGGGSHNADNNRRHGSTATSGNRGDGSDEGAGGTNGNGGSGDARGPGGGGFFTNGANADDSRGGYAYLNGGAGGNGEETCEGGFGGGGGPDGWGNYDYGGGGGGYSGGGGGGGGGDYCGGGGGSYNAGTNQSNAAGNRSGHGYVTITRVCE